jgi:hypothetical protein
MEEKQWRWSLLNWVLLWALLILALLLSGVKLIGAQTATLPSTSTSSAQALSRYSVQAEAEAAGEPPYYELRLYLRYSDGTAVAGEPVILERLPEELPMPCVTDEAGLCTWTVGRGLYQVVFDRPLDQISAVALAEGGLRGFGLTVGEADIAYHFVFHHDGRAYFDADPEAAVPVPIIPQFHSLQGGTLPLLDDQDLVGTPTEGPTVTPTPNEPDEDMTAAPVEGAAVFWLVGLGLLLGGGLHLLQRRWPPGRRRPTAASSAQTETPATAGTTAATGQTDSDDTHAPVDPTTITNPPTAAAAKTEEESHHA